MTSPFTNLSNGPKAENQINANTLTPAEKKRVDRIHIPSNPSFSQLSADTTIMDVWYLSGDENAAVKAFWNCNWAQFQPLDFTQPNVVKRHLPTSQYNRLQYIAAYSRLSHRTFSSARGLPEADLHTLTTQDGAVWVFDSEELELKQANYPKIIDAGARFPDDGTVGGLESIATPYLTPAAIRSAGVFGDIDTVYRYVRWLPGPRFVRTVHDNEEVLKRI